MGFIDTFKEIFNKEKTTVSVEEIRRVLQGDIDFVLGYFSFIDSPRSDPEEELPDEVSDILNDIAERREIADLETVYWLLLMFSTTFTPKYGALLDKQAALASAAQAIKLDSFTTLLALQRAEDFTRLYDLSEGLFHVEPEGHC